jgi:hypothetical protein
MESSKPQTLAVEFFPSVEGSLNSPDGQIFMFKVRRPDGQKLMLAFPHTEIPNIVESAAMRMDHGRDQEGEKIVSAFDTSSFALGIGTEGQTVLSLTVGEKGHINFLLPTDMSIQLCDALRKLQVRH